MSETQNGSFNCPSCGANLRAKAKAVFSPEIMTITYGLEPGRKMMVEDFCESLKALAKSMKLIARDCGVSVAVSLESVHISASEVSASVSVWECEMPIKAHARRKGPTA
jgi:hypothetical protein